MKFNIDQNVQNWPQVGIFRMWTVIVRGRDKLNEVFSVYTIILLVSIIIIIAAI